jgi:hypothetical protein
MITGIGFAHNFAIAASPAGIAAWSPCAVMTSLLPGDWSVHKEMLITDTKTRILGLRTLSCLQPVFEAKRLRRVRDQDLSHNPH